MAAACGALALLAALPTPAASASPARPAALSLPPGGVTPLSSSAATELLGEAQLGVGGIPLGPLEVPVLARLISERPGISQLSSIAALGEAEGVKQAIEAALGVLVAERQLVEELVGPFELAFDLEEQLEEAYEDSEATEAPGAPESLEELVEEELGKTPEELIDEGLETWTVGELLSLLLSEAASPATLGAQLLEAAEQEELEELLGTAPSGEPFTVTAADLEETAEALELSAAELAQTLGLAPSELPGAALALLTPLRDGRALGVFAGSKGLAFALFGPPPEAPEEEEPGEGGGETGEGETGGGGTPPGEPETPPTKTTTSGAGENPSAGTPPPMSTRFPSSAPSVAPATGPGAPAPLPARLAILAHRSKGALITLTIRIPGAGRLSVTGTGLRPLKRSFSRASARTTVTLQLSRASAASLRRGRRLKLRLSASFRSSGGPSSSVATTIKLG
ncbi:MAG TPA: hypothetical protein VHW67_11670 [Solirubrobacteraceae bacterium]|jgi:hypothetical protein|nr:hypothetical protein [Solirubrobacteraceae bacterium]